MSQCPGCPLENMPYQAQLELKRERLARALEAYPRLASLKVPAVLASPATKGYRNRARMVLNPAATSPDNLLGFYAEGGRELVPVQTCTAHHPQVERVLAALRPLLFARPNLRQFTRFVDVRTTAGHAADPHSEQAIITFAGHFTPGISTPATSTPAPLDVLRAEAMEIFDAISQELNDGQSSADQTNGDQTNSDHTNTPQATSHSNPQKLTLGVCLNISDEQNQAILSGTQLPIAGIETLHLQIGATQIGEVSSDAFFQVNLAQLAAVHQKMRENLRQSDILIDFYSGVGTHGIALAAPPDYIINTHDIEQENIIANTSNKAETSNDKNIINKNNIPRLLGFDASEAATERARANAARAGLTADYLSADAGQGARWASERYTQLKAETSGQSKQQIHGAADAIQVDSLTATVITNPARAGMPASALEQIARIDAAQLLYLSCEPQTLARDLDRLLDLGFEITDLAAFDFMPQTEQVETLVILKTTPTTAQNLDRLLHDFSQMDAPSQLDAPSHPAATTRHIERAFWPKNDRFFSLGVSGPAGFHDARHHETIQEITWIALVSGEVPKQGFLPRDRRKSKKRGASHAKNAPKNSPQNQQIRVERLRKVEGNSVIRIHTGPTQDVELRRRLRAWGHPVLGDPQYGDRQANHLLERHAYLDRLALHAVTIKTAPADAPDQTSKEIHTPAPGQFLSLMRLGRSVLDR